MTLELFLQFVGGIAAAGIVLGGLFAFATKGLKSTTVEIYEQENKALRSQVERLSSENKNQEVEMARMKAEILSLEKALDKLAREVTGAQLLAAINTKIDNNHRQVMQILGAKNNE